jgi:DNA-binding SARP family transcriptional activator
MVGGGTARGRGFHLLGPVEVRGEHGAVAIGGVRARCLLARLLLDAGRVVAVDDLVDAMWGDRPPAGARVQVQNRVSTLRTRLRAGGLGADLLVRQSPGYLLRVGDVPFDLPVFDRAVAHADALGREGRVADAAGALTVALDLWHGPALSGLDTPALRAAARHLDERRLRAAEARLRLLLELDRPADVAAELDALVDAHPYRESLAELQIRALAGAGRRSAAVEAFHRLRRRLADELGIDPGAAVQRTFRAVLGDPPPERGPVTVPAQLPADVPFAGRAAALAVLDAVLPGEPGRPRTTVLTGTAGVGKSALAVHWGTGSPGGSRTASCTSACGASRRTGGRRRSVRRCGRCWTRSACRPATCRRAGTRRSACTAAGWRGGGCWWCWTTPATPSRSVRCYPGRPAAWPW